MFNTMLITIFVNSSNSSNWMYDIVLVGNQDLEERGNPLQKVDCLI